MIEDGDDEGGEDDGHDNDMMMTMMMILMILNDCFSLMCSISDEIDSNDPMYHPAIALLNDKTLD